MGRRPYKKWNYQVWRAAVQELQRSAEQRLVIMVDGSAEQRLVIMVDGVLALDREPLGRAY